MNEEESRVLLERYRDGDESAAREIFLRYVDRLKALARARLSSRLARKVDPDDVVQSAYRSFFQRARDGKFEFSESGQLWSLLAKITLRKIYRQVNRYKTLKHSIDRERGLSDLPEISIAQLASEPSPAEIGAMAEELEVTLAGLDRTKRVMLEWFLQGKSVDEIAEEANYSNRTVRRLLAKVEEELRTRLMTCADEEQPDERS